MKTAATYIVIISVLFWTIFLYNFFAGMHDTDIPAQASSGKTLT